MQWPVFRQGLPHSGQTPSVSSSRVQQPTCYAFASLLFTLGTVWDNSVGDFLAELVPV